MSFITNFPLFAIILSLVCSVISFALNGKAAKILSYCLLITGIFLNSGVLLYNYSNGVGFTFMMGHHPAPFGNEIAAGYIEPAFAILFGIVILCSIVAGEKRIKKDIEPNKLNLYYIMVNLTQVALFSLCYTNDIFTGYVFVEICTIASCSLLMIRQTGRSLVAATRYMIFSLIGSGLFLIGIIMLYNVTGHLLFPQLKETVAMVWASGQYKTPMIVFIGLMVSGLAIKSGLFPFHFWMPDTYSTATPASSGILSGVVSKGYILLLIKIIYKVIGPEVFIDTGANNILFFLGIAGMIIGSISAIKSRAINRMVAFSSAAQIGYIYMGIGMGSKGAIIAAFFHIIAHAITKPVLFISAGALADASDGNKDFSSIRGSAHRNPFAGFAFLCGSLSMIGIPIFSGFISKLFFATSAFGLGYKTIFVLFALAISTILNVIYFMYIAVIIFIDKDTQKKVLVKEQLPFIIALSVLLIINIIIGIHSQPFYSVIVNGLELLRH